MNIPSVLALGLFAALSLSGCKAALEQTDLEEFVDTGLTNVLLRSATFSPGSQELELVPSATPITCAIEIVNPKGFDVQYSVGWNVDSSLFTPFFTPATNPTPSDASHLSFTFTLDTALAEHKTITFSLGKYVPSINKTYEPETFSITCDSPPHGASRVSAARDIHDYSVLGIILPNDLSDQDDLAQIVITWQQDNTSAVTTAYAIGDLALQPLYDPFSVVYDRYLLTPPSSAGHACTYSVYLVDRAGQQSPTATATSAPGLFPFSYDANGATAGVPPATVGRNATSGVTVEPQGSLARSGYTFSGWNTAADGQGTDYAPGSTYTMPASEAILYAQWDAVAAPSGTAHISFVLGNAGIAFTPSDATFARGSMIEISCSPSSSLPAGTTTWRWYLNGSIYSSTTDPLLRIQTTEFTPLGQYVLSCVAICDGLSYSGSVRFTVIP